MNRKNLTVNIPADVDRYRTMPAIYLPSQNGQPPQPAPFLLSPDELMALLRLNDGSIKFPIKTIYRYRRMGLRATRVGRRVWFRLDDVLRFLDQQQDRLDDSAP